MTGVEKVGSLAVDNEPCVFWDGSDSAALVDKWRSDVDFPLGDGDGELGRIAPGLNGTSGRSVVKDVLDPLGIAAEAVWFTDAVDRFYVKKAPAGSKKGESKSEQADVIDRVYRKVAERFGNLPDASLPARPSREELIRIATTEQRARLLAEIEAASPPQVVTLGEEARRVVLALSDGKASGPPTDVLTGAATITGYGAPGQATVAGHTFSWRALIHPGLRNPAWRLLHERWSKEVGPPA